MAIVLIVSFIVAVIAAGYLLKVSLGDMLPFIWSVLVLVLYPLALFRGLSLIDYILPAGALALFILAVKKNRSREEKLGAYAASELTSAPVIIYVLIAVIVTLCAADKVVTWWDDINFWASDVKSIYCLDGFASKYANVSPEFGDYPPGIQLAKWFLLHMNRHEFSEGLAFTGYYLFNLSFMLPIFKQIKKKNIWLVIPLTVVTWFFAGTVDKYGYAGFCADLSMAYVFGSILIAAFAEGIGSPLFDRMRMGAYLAVLVLIKSTGSLWALFGIIIWAGVCWHNVTYDTFKKRVRMLIPVLVPFIYGASWMAFCLKMHRVTKTTSTAITYITTDKYGLSDYTSQFAVAFIKAFFTESVHVDRTGLIIPPALMLAAIIAALVLLYKKGYMPGKSGRFVAIVLPLMGLIYYAAIFLAHITLFATETQYLEASAMIASIERYGLPFMMGSLMLIAWIWLGNMKDIELSQKEVMIRSLVFSAAVMILTDIPAAWDGLAGYRSHIKEDLEGRQEFVDSEAEMFTDTLKDKLPEADTRVCRLHDGGYYRVADTYVNYEASPVSVIDISYDLSQIDEGSLIIYLDQTHASYLYADEQAEVPAWLDDMADNGKFNYRTLYFISYEDGGMKLYEQ